MVRNVGRIPILWPWELPETLGGLVVVIDVYAASTNLATFIGKGASEILLVNSDNVASARQKRPGALVIGESRKLSPDFFDYSNHPADHAGIDFSGRSILYMSYNGTRVIEEAFEKGAEQVGSAAIVNLSSVASWITWITASDQAVTLVPAGEGGSRTPAVAEDRICAEALRNLLMGRKIDSEALVRGTEETMRSFYTREAATDLKFVLARDRYPVVPVCHRDQDGLIRVSTAGE